MEKRKEKAEWILAYTDNDLSQMLKDAVSWDNEWMHVDADEILLKFLKAIWYNKSAEQYEDMMKDFWYA